MKENTFAVLYQGNKAAASKGGGVGKGFPTTKLPPSEINSSDTTLPGLPCSINGAPLLIFINKPSRQYSYAGELRRI
jgi:hypothetical protein